MNIANRVLQLCDQRRITPNHLAEICDMTQSTINGILSERNRTVKLSTIEKICEGLNITLAEFFTEEAVPDLPPEALYELHIFMDYLRHKYIRK